MKNNANMYSATRKSSGRAHLTIAMLLVAAFGLTACGAFGGGTSSNFPSQSGSQGRTDPNPSGAERQTIWGEGGISLWGGGDDKKDGGGAGIGVNSFLWRASLDTISFMPLASADPFGGVIITDWYQDPKSVGERFKVTIYILDRRLRADGVKVSLFRQTHDAKGGWVDAKVDVETAIKIENAILVRARQLRISTLEAEDK